MQSYLIRIILLFCATYNGVRSDICITARTLLHANFFGNYVPASTPDINGNIYYEKQQTYEEQQDCLSNNQQEYLYLNTNNQWQTSYTLNDAISYIKCPTPSTTPDQCANIWTINNGVGIDPSITASNIPCPPTAPYIPSLTCSGSITIQSSNELCSGVFNQIDIGLYHKSGDCGPYFYYNPYREVWECGPDDKRDYCWAKRDRSSPYYLSSISNQIETMGNGETIMINLEYPMGEIATITCGGLPVFTPMMACNFIELKYSGDCDVDGVYSSVFNRPNLYKKTDPNNNGNPKYFQYTQGTQSYVVADADITNQCDATSTASTTPTMYLKSVDYSIRSLINGQHNQPLQLEFPTNGNAATISCLLNEKAIKPTPFPLEGDLCVVTPSWLNGCPNYWEVSGLYRAISVVNGFLAYKLQTCESVRYLFYVEYFSRWVIGNSLENPPNEIFFYCENENSALEQCQWSNPTLIQVSDALSRVDGCDCNSEL